MGISYPAMWFTSGTPLKLGQSECRMERYLAFHAGQHGTGYRRRATAIPLATGAGVHDGIGLIGEWILDRQAAKPNDRLLEAPDSVIAWAATEAANKYERTARECGLELTKSDLDVAAAIDQLILEQRTLIEAQVWIYALARLPVMLASAKLVDIEHEEGPVVACTCGLGDWVGQWTDHAARQCRGICPQGRADAIWEMYADSTLVYEEIKTKATPNYGWEQQWEHSGQLWLNMHAAGLRLGREVSQAYVPILLKGKRDRVNRDDRTQPKIQQSPLCWPWFDSGEASLRAPEWASRYKWIDDWGKWHTLPRSYRRVALWDEANELPAGSNPNGVVVREGASRVERWVKGWIAPGQYGELLKTLGPFPKPAQLMVDAERALIAEETWWRDVVARLRAAGVYQAGDQGVEDHPEDPPLAAADLIPRSWACTKFAGDACSFKKICFREPGWENLDTHPDFDIRTPHHAIEKLAFEQAGVVFPVEVGEDEDGGES